MKTIDEQLRDEIADAQAQLLQELELLARRHHDAQIDEILVSFAMPAPYWLDDWKEFRNLLRRSLRGWRRNSFASGETQAVSAP